jgi:glycosyltransferase involved in cell wall biosynthesis
MLKLAEYLQDSGCDVHVLCARTLHNDAYGYEQLLSSLKVTYVDDPLALVGSRVFRGEIDRKPSQYLKISYKLKHWFKKLLLDILTPDTAVLMLNRMYKVAKKNIEFSPHATVITSGPPHSVHLIGRRIKQNYPQVEWCVDYRDSWNATSLFRKSNRIAQWLNKYFENGILNKCDHFFYISKPILIKSQKIFDYPLENKSYLVANGFDKSQFLIEEIPQGNLGPLRIGYFGALDDSKESYRNPTCVFHALADIPEDSIRVELYGAIKLRPEWQAILGQRLVVGKRLQHEEAINKMKTMDALILLHTRDDGADEVMTGKVFEYIASGLPIVSVGPKHMAVNELADSDPTILSVDHNDVQGIRSLLSWLVVSKVNLKMPKRQKERIDIFSRDTQFEVILKLLKHHQNNPKWPL